MPFLVVAVAVAVLSPASPGDKLFDGDWERQLREDPLSELPRRSAL